MYCFLFNIDESNWQMMWLFQILRADKFLESDEIYVYIYGCITFGVTKDYTETSSISVILRAGCNNADEGSNEEIYSKILAD